MWIRSQDKRRLVNIKWVSVYNEGGTDICGSCNDNGPDDTGFLLGEYESEQRALEVLDEIQSAIINLKTHELYPPDARDGGYWTKVFTVFQMPEK